MENIERWKSLAGIITEGPVNAALSRGDISSPEESKEFGLYVGERNSGQLDLVFKGDKAECLSKWQDELIGSFGDKRMVFRVVPMYDGVPNHITEAFEETDEQNGYTLNEKEDKVDEPTKSDAEASDNEAKVDKEPAVKVPADISKAIDTRISEIKAAIEEFDEKGFNDNSVKKNALEALEQIKDNLSKPNGKKLANIFINTLMGPIQQMIPPKVIKFVQTMDTASKKKVAETVVPTEDDALTESTLRQELQELTNATAQWKKSFENVVAILRRLDKNDPQSAEFLANAGKLIPSIAQQSGQFEDAIKKVTGWTNHPHARR